MVIPIAPRAYQQGYQANLDGQSRLSPNGTTNRAGWLQGWDAAQSVREDRDGDNREPAKCHECGGPVAFPHDTFCDDCNARAEEQATGDRCTNPGGHQWSYTGTRYGGDDERWSGEGRCLCVHCGADGDA